MAPPDLCFVHLSDIHLLEDPTRLQYGVCTAEILERAIPQVNSVRPDLILVGGDLTSDEKEASYRQARAALARLAAPAHAVMGNHDDRRIYRSVFFPERSPGPEPVTGAFDAGSCRFLLLDSQVPGAVAGRMDPAQLTWLDTDLATSGDRPTVVVVHHPPLPIGVRWLDNLGFLNGQDLVGVLRRHPQVRAVLFGHIHQPRIWRYEGILFASVPALAFQFSPVEQEPTGRHITQDTPGFRVVRVWNGGRDGVRLQTALHYLDGRIVPDPPVDRLPEYSL